MGKTASRNRKVLAAVFGLAVAGAAVAAVSPLLIGVQIDGSGLLTMNTDQLPKGWLSTKNVFDRGKTNIQTVYSLGATSCSTAVAGGTLNSTTDGSFTTENNPSGGVTGYYYSVSKDLSAAQNHWYSHQHCDGSVEVHGCDQPIPVTVTATAYDKNGSCHTYVNDSGQTVCASDTKTASLGAVEDPEVVDTQCGGDSCGIGQCVSSCEHDAKARYDAAVASCAAGKDGNGCRKAAQDQQLAEKQACPCTCMESRPAGCPAAPDSCSAE